MKQYAENQIYAISIFIKEYPKLKQFIDPPWVSICKRKQELLEQAKQLAVIGLRKPTRYDWKH